MQGDLDNLSRMVSSRRVPSRLSPVFLAFPLYAINVHVQLFNLPKLRDGHGEDMGEMRRNVKIVDDFVHNFSEVGGQFS